MKKILLATMALYCIPLHAATPGTPVPPTGGLPIQHQGHWPVALPNSVQLVNSNSIGDASIMPMMLATMLSHISQQISQLSRQLGLPATANPYDSFAQHPLALAAQKRVGSSFLSQLHSSIRATHLGIGASCLGATLAWLKMKFLTHSALRRGRWASWRSDIPIHTLMELSDEEIVTQLWPAIRDHYATDGQVLDVFAILRAFLDDIHQERTCLQDLMWWYNLIRSIKLGGLLGDDESESKAKLHCERIDFLEDCVHVWANMCLCKDGIAKEHAISKNRR